MIIQLDPPPTMIIQLDRAMPDWQETKDSCGWRSFKFNCWKSVLSVSHNDLYYGLFYNDLEEAKCWNVQVTLNFLEKLRKLQDDIDKLFRWSEKWQILFNFGKCKCLHLGPGNTGMNYEMGGTILSKTVKEKGVTMNANMKVSEQCRIAVSNISGFWNDSEEYNV